MLLTCVNSRVLYAPMKSTHVRLSKEAHRSVSKLSKDTGRGIGDLVSLAAARLVEDAKAGRVSLGIVINDHVRVTK